MQALNLQTMEPFNMRVIKARDLLLMTNDELFALPHGKIKLVFDDGEIETTVRETVFSASFWVFQKLYPRTPLLIRHHIGNKRLGSNTHATILENCMFDCYDVYYPELEVENLCKIVYETVNNVFNEFSYRLEAYVTSISILDFIDVVEDPEIKEVKSKVKPNQVSIDDAYKKINNVLKDENKLVGNAIAKAAKSGLVSIDQIDQCIGLRGYISDIDSHIFKHPILKGYVEGISTLLDIMMESRSASKALMFTKDPLQSVEYFNRQIQLVCATFKSIVEGDCGSQRYLKFNVRSGDLESVVGKFYLDETDNKVKRITRADRHLIGKTLKIRSILFCQLHDNHSRCSTCFGNLFLSIPKHTNQGHLSSTILGEKASQNVMSTKHLDGSSKIDDIELSELDSQFIECDINPNHLRFSSNLANKKVSIVINAKEATGLPDINYTKNVENLSISRITQLVDVKFCVTNANNEIEETVISVSIGNRLSSFTYEMLDYIKAKGWTINKDQNYEIDLSDWDFSTPVFILPMKHLSMVDHMRSVESFIKNPPSKIKKEKDQDMSVDNVFYQLFKLVSTKIRFNIAHLEVIMYSTMITSSANKDYDIPYTADNGEYHLYSTVMKNRSLSGSMAYQGHVSVLLDPASFIIRKRPEHMFDPLILG